MHVTLHDDKYYMTFDYSADKVTFCKNLQQSRYSPQGKCWSAARNVPNAIDLKNAGYFHDEEMLDPSKQMPTLLDLDAVSVWKIHASLYPPQERFRQWCRNVPRAMLIAAMGTGKTLMSLLWLHEHKLDPDDVLIICPASLLGNWEAEIRKFTGFDSIMVTGSTSQRKAALSERGIHIVNYDYLPVKGATETKAQLRGEIAALNKRVVIMDESHKVKTPSSARSKVLQEYARNLTHVLLMTGTPISQGAHDYYSQFRIINPHLLGTTFTTFKARYCLTEAVRGAPPGVSRITGYRLLEELNAIIKPYTFTIDKSEYGGMPEKIYQEIRVKMDSKHRRIYNQMRDEMLVEIKASTEPVTAPNILTRLSKLSQITQGFIIDETGDTHRLPHNPKAEVAEELMTADKEPMIFVCRFREDITVLKEICEKLQESYVVIDGTIPIPDRQALVDKFQAGKYRIMLGQVRTMGVGYNITAASRMVFYSNTYSLVDRQQAEDRINRIGATAQFSQYIDLVAEDTIDERVIEALKNKKDVANTLMQMCLEN